MKIYLGGGLVNKLNIPNPFFIFLLQAELTLERIPFILGRYIFHPYLRITRRRETRKYCHDLQTLNTYDLVYIKPALVYICCYFLAFG
jgi:hypothetical protein